MRIIALALLLTSCTSAPAERVYTPTEELWIDAYCHRTLIYPEDAERVTRWAEKKRIECK